MNVVERVGAELRRGGTVDSVAARLALPTDLVAAIVAELVPAASAACAPTPTACRACPLAAGCFPGR